MSMLSVQIIPPVFGCTHLRPGWSAWSCTRSPDQAKHAQDRKSTRLNSSHDQISYAVFCLKKKKTTHSKHSEQTNHAQQDTLATRCDPTPALTQQPQLPCRSPLPDGDTRALLTAPATPRHL